MQTNPLAQDLDFILENTQEVWKELCGQKIFITGGTGFFGCWFLESFVWAVDCLNLDSSVLVLSRDPNRFQKKAPHLFSHQAIHFHKGDVCDFTFPDGKFSYVIHAAAESDPIEYQKNSLSAYETIVGGTRRVLEFARNSSTKKFLLTSSGAVYGQQPGEMTHISEDYQGAPDTIDFRSMYGEAKRMAELLSVIYSDSCGFEVKIARCFAFVGPYFPFDKRFAIGNFIRDKIEGKPIFIEGDGTPFRSYLYAADLIVWLWNILSRGKNKYPYNVGSDKEITVSDLAREIASLSGVQSEIRIAKERNPNAEISRYVPCVERIKLELGLKEQFDLKTSILKTMEWYSRKD